MANETIAYNKKDPFQINSNSSLHILDGKVVDLADGSFIQPFAEFSLN
jgi:hypothetical protein